MAERKIRLAGTPTKYTLFRNINNALSSF